MSRLSVLDNQGQVVGLPKSPSHEDAQAFKDSMLLEVHNQPLRTQSAETMQVGTPRASAFPGYRNPQVPGSVILPFVHC
jgi:hypothetical protein